MKPPPGSHSRRRLSFPNSARPLLARLSLGFPRVFTARLRSLFLQASVLLLDLYRPPLTAHRALERTSSRCLCLGRERLLNPIGYVVLQGPLVFLLVERQGEFRELRHQSSSSV